MPSTKYHLVDALTGIAWPLPSTHPQGFESATEALLWAAVHVPDPGYHVVPRPRTDDLNRVHPTMANVLRTVFPQLTPPPVDLRPEGSALNEPRSRVSTDPFEGR